VMLSVTGRGDWWVWRARWYTVAVMLSVTGRYSAIVLSTTQEMG